MSETYSISKDVIHSIFQKIISTNEFKHKNNADHALSILLRELNESSIEILTTLLLTEKEYIPLKVGDYVKVKVPSYHAGNEFEHDVMIDMGLMKEEETNICYGIVRDDTSWSSDKEFNPFYSSLKVDLLYHNTDKELKHHEITVNPMAISKIAKGHIRYFKKQNSKSLPNA
mgnify:CR=1 FL=1|tara:strand:+ start:1427 stop:1942 length:516 start_codon:yes stop_codon:yes gene_type:complete